MEAFPVPIFKFSSLVCILPYFGHLHDWKVIMSTLCSHSRLIWDQNFTMFLNAGRNLKKTVRINEKNVGRLLIEQNYDTLKKFIEFEIDATNWTLDHFQVLFKFIKMMEETEMVVVECINPWINLHSLKIKDRDMDVWNKEDSHKWEARNVVQSWDLEYTGYISKFWSDIQNMSIIAIYSDAYATRFSVEDYENIVISQNNIYLPNFDVSQNWFVLLESHVKRIEASKKLFIFDWNERYIRLYKNIFLRMKSVVDTIYWDSINISNKWILIWEIMKVLKNVTLNIEVRDKIDITQQYKVLDYETMRVTLNPGIATIFVRDDQAC